MSAARLLLPLVLVVAAGAVVGPKVLGRLGITWTSQAPVDLDRPPVDLSGIRGPEGTDCGLGVNLAYQAYWSSQIAFVDLFAQSSEWLPQEADGSRWDTGEPLDLDARGWVRRLSPGQAAGKLMARDLEGRYPGGLYHLTWRGNGRLELLGDGTIVHSELRKHLVRVEPTNAGIHLKLVETDPSDPLRDIRFVRDGHEETFEREPFTPELLAFLEPFGLLRMMDWQRTNGSTQVDFAGRVTLEQHTQSGPAGVSLERCVDLANRLGKDVWLCVPHLADDAYVRGMAELVRDRVEPELRVWVEYSNEVWNDQFEQAQWAEERGLQLDLSGDPFQARLRFYARRAVEVFAIWEEVFGDGADERLVRVLAGQCANPWTAETILGWKDAAEHADAYAVAPYVGVTLGSPQRHAITLALDSDGLFEALDEDLVEVLTAVRANVIEAAEHDLPLVAYEAGQHLVGFGGVQDDATLTARFTAANRDPRMGALYTRLLEGWRALGGRSVCLWSSVETWSKWGSWGLVEYVDTPREAAPKLDAALDFAQEHERWW